jgi:ribosomal protein L13
VARISIINNEKSRLEGSGLESTKYYYTHENKGKTHNYKTHRTEDKTVHVR